jgi:hypothetical protein
VTSARHVCPIRAGALVDRHQPCLVIVIGLVDHFRFMANGFATGSIVYIDGGALVI